MDTKIIWSAGLLDADGTITIKRALRYGKYHYIPLIQVAQVDTYKGRANLELLKNIYGGHISSGTKYSLISKGKSNTIIWQVTSKDAGNVAKQILDYSVGKDRQVKLLKEYVDKFHGEDYIFHRLSDKERNEREIYFLKMRSFQEKGFSPTTTKRRDTIKPIVM